MMINTQQDPADDLIVAMCCARIVLLSQARPAINTALQVLIINLMATRIDNEDALVLLQASCECIRGKIRPQTLERLLDQITPSPSRNVLLRQANDSSQTTNRKSPRQTTSTSQEHFEGATRLAATALSMAPQTTEARAFVYGIKAFEQQLPREYVEYRMLTRTARRFLEGQWPRQELERHVQSACKAFNEMRHEARLGNENTVKRKKP